MNVDVSVVVMIDLGMFVGHVRIDSIVMLLLLRKPTPVDTKSLRFMDAGVDSSVFGAA